MNKFRGGSITKDLDYNNNYQFIYDIRDNFYYISFLSPFDNSKNHNNFSFDREHKNCILITNIFGDI